MEGKGSYSPKTHSGNVKEIVLKMYTLLHETETYRGVFENIKTLLSCSFRTEIRLLTVFSGWIVDDV